MSAPHLVKQGPWWNRPFYRPFLTLWWGVGGVRDGGGVGWRERGVGRVKEERWVGVRGVNLARGDDADFGCGERGV